MFSPNWNLYNEKANKSDFEALLFLPFLEVQCMIAYIFVPLIEKGFIQEQNMKLLTCFCTLSVIICVVQGQSISYQPYVEATLELIKSM